MLSRFLKIIKLFNGALKRHDAFFLHFISFTNQDDKERKTVVLTILAIIISITAHFNNATRSSKV